MTQPAGAPISLASGAVTLGSSLPANANSALPTQDALSHATDAAFSAPNGCDGFSTVPCVTLNLDGGVLGTGSLASALALPSVIGNLDFSNPSTVTAVLNNRTFQSMPFAMAGGKLSVGFVTGEEHGLVFGVTFGMDLARTARVSGDAAAYSNLRSTALNMLPEIAPAQATITAITNLVNNLTPQVRTLQQLVNSHASASQLVNAAAPLLAQVKRAEALLGQAQALLTEGQSALNHLGTDDYSFALNYTQTADLTMKETVSGKLAAYGQGENRGELRLLIGGELVVPLSKDVLSPPAFAQNLTVGNSSMVRVDAAVQAGGQVVSLSGLLGQAQQLLNQITPLRAVADQPLQLANAQKAAQVEQQAAAIAKQAQALQAQASSLLAGGVANLNTGVKTTEANGNPGFGLSDITLRLTGRAGQNFYRLSGGVKDPVGFLPGYVSFAPLTQGSDGSVGAAPTNVRSANVYSAFFPVRVVVDGLVGRQWTAKASTDGRLGVAVGPNDTSVGYLSANQHFAVSPRFGDYVFGVGGTIPSLSHPTVLPPLLSAATGFQGPAGNLMWTLTVNPANFGANSGAAPEGLRAMLSYEKKF